MSTANLTQRAANDDVVVDNTIQTSQLRTKVNQGDVSFIAVDGFGTATGNITLTSDHQRRLRCGAAIAGADGGQLLDCGRAQRRCDSGARRTAALRQAGDDVGLVLVDGTFQRDRELPGDQVDLRLDPGRLHR